MDTPEKRKPPWWKKKRWAAALALWLTVAYFGGVGVSCYTFSRGWLPFDAANAINWPARQLVYAEVPVLEDAIAAYMRWCCGRGYEDAGWIVEVDAEGNFRLWPATSN